MKHKNYIYIAGAVVVAAGLFLVLKPRDTASLPHKKSVTLEVKQKKLVSGPQTITVKQGDTVSITITTDESEELHLHGYDASIDLEKGTPATLTITADKTGRFEYELEHAHQDIGVLEVQPK